MEFENLILKKEERIAHLIINRPQALNALNQDTLIEMRSESGKVLLDSGK